MEVSEVYKKIEIMKKYAVDHGTNYQELLGRVYASIPGYKKVQTEGCAFNCANYWDEYIKIIEGNSKEYPLICGKYLYEVAVLIGDQHKYVHTFMTKEDAEVLCRIPGFSVDIFEDGYELSQSVLKEISVSCRTVEEYALDTIRNREKDKDLNIEECLYLLGKVE